MWVIIVIILVFAAISFITDKLDDWFFENSPFFHSIWSFIGDNFFLFCAFSSLALAGFVFVYFRPHPAEKHFSAYKKDLINRDQAIERIANTMYDYRRDKLPSVRKSRSLERRVQALRRRVKAEEAFINDLINYMRAKARVK
jgi:uncharacterized membrane protein